MRKFNDIYGDYKIIGQVKKGVRTPVFVASDSTGKRVALKISSKNSIINEYNLMMQFDHPNILKPIDLLQEGSKNVLVMPLASQDLEGYILEHQNLPEEKKRIIMHSLFTAIMNLHEKGVWHRDIKPQNILVFQDTDSCTEETFVLADLEFAGFFDNTPPKCIQGTCMYMAPEILLRYSYCNKIDCWAAGVVMSYLYMNKYPFEQKLEMLLGDLNFNCEISTLAKDLIDHLVCLDQDIRYSAEQALNHPYFRSQESVSVDRISREILDKLESDTSDVEG